MNLEICAAKTIDKFNMLSHGDQVVIGLSGGADSVALLYILNSIKDKYNLKLHAAHINHMIRGEEAERDEGFAKSVADALNIEFHLLKCDIPKLAKEQGISEEMAGRNVRYEFFESIAPKIAVAHHRSDSAETTLINLIRGSSLKGLRGIMPVNGNIIRPLIECDRADIEKYLKDNNIPFVNDSTNSENIYTRNCIRNVIIPEIKKINPNITSTIFENSRILAEDEDYIAIAASGFAVKCIYTEEDNVILDLTTHENLHIALKRRLVIAAVNRLTGNRCGLTSANIESVLALPTGGRTQFNNIYVTRSYNKYIFSKSVKEIKNYSYNITSPCTVYIQEINKVFNFEIISADDNTVYEFGTIYLDADKAKHLILRSRRDGDVFSPLGLKGRKKVKAFLIDAKIPRYIRDTIPVLECNGKIAAILCERADEAYKVTEKTTKILKISEVEKC